MNDYYLSSHSRTRSRHLKFCVESFFFSSISGCNFQIGESEMRRRILTTLTAFFLLLHCCVCEKLLRSPATKKSNCEVFFTLITKDEKIKIIIQRHRPLFVAKKITFVNIYLVSNFLSWEPAGKWEYEKFYEKFWAHPMNHRASFSGFWVWVILRIFENIFRYVIIIKATNCEIICKNWQFTYQVLEK